jgi:hypothetical protein
MFSECTGWGILVSPCTFLINFSLGINTAQLILSEPFKVLEVLDWDLSWLAIQIFASCGDCQPLSAAEAAATVADK